MLNKCEYPANWKTIKLGDIADFKNGLNYRAGENKFSYRILSVASFQDYGVIRNLSDLPNVDLDHPLEEGYRLIDKDLVFVRSNGNPDLVGRCIMVFPGDVPATFSGFTIRARIIKNKIVSSEWAHICLRAGLLKKSLKREGAGTNITNLNQQILSSVLIPVPSMEEQKAIAAILSTWDEAIEKTERLIKLKERQLTSFIHRLIHGKNTDRQEFRLGCIAEMQSGGTPLTSNSDYFNGDISWVSISDMTSRGKYVFDTNNKITQSGLENSSAKIFPSGTVLYAMYASIGECSIAKTPLSTSQAILGIQPSSRLYNEYLYYYLLSIKNKIRKQGQQGTQSNLNAKMVKDFRLYLPSFEKQKKIAGTLNDIQIEIDVLTRKMELLCKQKQGLMQKFLTGNWRVNFKDEK